jgi:hypothetical protein
MEQNPSREANSHSVNKLPFCYGTQSFIIVFKTARHWPLPWAKCIYFTPSHLISQRSVLIISSHLRLVLPSGSRLQAFRPKCLCIHITIMHATCSAHLTIDYPNNMWWSVQFTKLLIMQSSPASCHFLLLRSKFSPHYPVLRLSLCSSLSVRDQVSHRYKVICNVMILYILIFKLLERTWKKKVSKLNGSKHSLCLNCS